MLDFILAASERQAGGLIDKLFFIMIIAICAAAIYFVGRWAISKLAGATALMCWNGLFLIVGLIVVLDLLLSFVDKDFIRW